MLDGFDPAHRVIRLAGPEARDFLQGLVTNDVAGAEGERAVYAALLTPQGKYLFDFIVLDDGEGGLLLDAAAEQAPPLAQRLALYRLRRKVEIAEAPLKVALVWGEGAVPVPEGGRVVEDPRAEGLARRVYAPEAPLAAVGARDVGRAGWDARRVAFAVPEAGVELTPDTFVLEAGFERLNGVDFRKGCFVGQEIVARMKHKTALRKGLVRVAVEGEAPPPGTPVETADGKPAGALHTVAGGAGLAHLRFDRAEGELAAGAARLRRLEG